MAAKMAHNFQVDSRFSVLANDDSHSSDGDETKNKNDEAKKKTKNAKKRARKKKKAAAETAEAKELRSMAFGGKAKQVQHGNVTKLHPSGEERPSVHNQENHEWVERDKQFIVNQFQEDLEEALQRSLEDEKNKQLQDKIADNIPLKKKNKDHSVKLSLDEFQVKSSEITISNEMHGANAFLDSSSNQPNIEIVPKKHKKKKDKNQKSVTTEEILKGAVNTQKMNDVKSTQVLDPASIQQWMNEVDKRNQENEALKSTIEELREELAEVKKRNKQLCFILGQGEMRDKSDILQQIDLLTNVKDELSSELSEMHSLLEQERSKVSTLKLELAKSQTGRSKKPSFSENGHR